MVKKTKIKHMYLQIYVKIGTELDYERRVSMMKKYRKVSIIEKHVKVTDLWKQDLS